jgi:hypothetical protein
MEEKSYHDLLEFHRVLSLKFEMAARSTGWDVLSSRLKSQSARAMVKHGVGDDVGDTVERERVLGEGQEGSKLMMPRGLSTSSSTTCGALSPGRLLNLWIQVYLRGGAA